MLAGCHGSRIGARVEIICEVVSLLMRRGPSRIVLECVFAYTSAV